MQIIKLFGAVLIGGGLAGQAAAQDAVAADTVVASVDGTEITAGHLALMRQQLPPQYQSLEAGALYSGLLQQAISQVLLSQSLDGVDTATRIELETQERAIRSNAAMLQIAEEAVTDQAIQQAYNAQYGSADPSQEFRAAHILVDDRQQAVQLKSQIDQGGDFATLAQQNSTGPSASQGGDLGWFAAGDMVAPFSDAISQMAVGDVSDPVETQFGWHVIQLNDTRTSEVPDLAQVRDQIRAQLQQEAVNDRLDTLMQSAEVTRTDVDAIDPGFLSDPAALFDQ